MEGTRLRLGFVISMGLPNPGTMGGREWVGSGGLGSAEAAAAAPCWLLLWFFDVSVLVSLTQEWTVVVLELLTCGIFFLMRCVGSPLLLPW